jgi:hypothetical protein
MELLIAQVQFFAGKFQKSKQKPLPVQVLTGKSDILCTLISLLTSILIKHNIVAVNGDSARRTFFGSKELNFLQGYLIFQGAVSLY